MSECGSPGVVLSGKALARAQAACAHHLQATAAKQALPLSCLTPEQLSQGCSVLLTDTKSVVFSGKAAGLLLEQELRGARPLLLLLLLIDLVPLLGQGQRWRPQAGKIMSEKLHDSTPTKQIVMQGKQRQL